METIMTRMGTTETGGRRGHDPPRKCYRHDSRITTSGHYSVLKMFIEIMHEIFNMF